MNKQKRAAREEPAPETDGTPGGFLIPAGLGVALLSPWIVFIAMTGETVHEGKLAAAGAGAALALVGLARRARAEGTVPKPPRSAGVLLVALALLGASSVLGNAGRVDPLVAVPVGTFVAVALVSGALEPRLARRLVAFLAGAGALSAFLALLQRFAGVLRPPLVAPESRFHAVALLGNPGDLGAALVLPALFLWHEALDASAPRARRVGAALALAVVAAGMAATEAVTPLAALVAGLLVHAAFSPRRRLVPLGVAAIAILLALAVTGAGARLRTKLGEASRGDVRGATTERDIGLRAAAEMVRERPLLGQGPGGYADRFVPARVSAERRLGRRLVHSSGLAHFDNAHSEPLTLAAEAGLPFALGAYGLLAVLLAALVRQARENPPVPEAASPGLPGDLLAAALAGVAVLSLASFPLRMPASSVAIAFVLGLSLNAISNRSSGWRFPARASLAVLGIALLFVSLVRWVAAGQQATGEAELRDAVAAEPEARAALVASARRRLAAAVALRPRYAPPWLALGSTFQVEGDAARAWLVTARSLAISERAETDLNMGRIAFARGDAAMARAFFLRAVWILPWIASSLPDGVDAPSIRSDVRGMEKSLATGGEPPPLPAF